MLEIAVIEFLSAMQGDATAESIEPVPLPPEQTLAFLAFVASFTRWRAPMSEAAN